MAVKEAECQPSTHILEKGQEQSPKAGALREVRGGVMARGQVRDQAGSMIIPAPTLKKPGPREVGERRISSPGITQLKRGESQSQTPALWARAQYPGTSGGPRGMVVALTGTSSSSGTLVPFG